jgi:hypothetical protein
MEHSEERAPGIEPSDAKPQDGDRTDYDPSGEAGHAVEDRPKEQASREPDDEGFSAGAE